MQTTTTTTPGLTGSMLIGSLLAETKPYNDRSNCAKGMRRFAARHSLDVALLEVVGEAPEFRFQLKPLGPPTRNAAPTDETYGPALQRRDANIAELGGETDPLEIPEWLKVANRKDLTTGQKERLDAWISRRGTAGTEQDPKLPRHIEPAGLKLIEENAAMKQTKAAARIAKLKASPAGQAAAARRESRTTRRVTSAIRATKEAKAAKKAGAAKPAKAGDGKSKGEQVVALLKARWTPMADITAATGWLKHTARAFISRLNTKDKMGVETKREDGVTSYRIG